MKILEQSQGRVVVRIDVKPVPAPRQTQSDRWRKGADARPEVERYHTFKDEIWYEWRAAKLACPALSEVHFPEGGAILTFFIPVLRTYPAARKAKLIGRPHRGRKDKVLQLDKDNLEKAFFDGIFPANTRDDSHIWFTTSHKIWCDVDEGCIVADLVFNLPKNYSMAIYKGYLHPGEAS